MRAALCLVLALGSAAVACGARTGLLDAPAADAAAPTDAGPDAPPPECVADRDCDDGFPCTRDRCDRAAGRCAHAADDRACDDGRYCNGVERCQVGAGCAAGAPVACDDGAACTRDRCDEPTRHCAAATDDALCPISHRCDAARGCIARALANTATQLYEIELPSAVLRLIGPVRAFTDIALSPDRTLYAVTTDGTLWTLDAATGASTAVGSTGQNFTAFDAAPDGRLYGAGRAGIFRVDPASSGATLLAPFPPGLEASGDVAFLGTRLLATARPGFNLPDTLVEFDTARGSATVVGPVGYACVWGLAAFGPTLYGLTCNGEVLGIDPVTGRGRLLARGAASFYGATAR